MKTGAAVMFIGMITGFGLGGFAGFSFHAAYGKDLN